MSQCAVCMGPTVVLCPKCEIVGYCGIEHSSSDNSRHETFCRAASTCKYTAHGEVQDAEDWRQIRVQTLSTIQGILGRSLTAQETESVLFPPRCKCGRTRVQDLQCCRKCMGAWCCADCTASSHPEADCRALALMKALQRSRMPDLSLPYGHQCSNSGCPRRQSMLETLLHLCGEKTPEEKLAVYSQMATAPLTVLSAMDLIKRKEQEKATEVGAGVVLHVVGAERYFEAANLEAWEVFFMHLNSVKDLRVVMIGPELGVNQKEHRLRMCKNCKKKRRSITFEFVNELYHDFAKQPNFCQPDLIAAFNPGLHRVSGYQNTDSWPATLRAVLQTGKLFVFTSYTAFEAPKDLQRVQSTEDVTLLIEPQPNRFSSLLPSRNFISDQETAVIFKNFYWSAVVKRE